MNFFFFNQRINSLELLELLQVNNSNILAEQMTDESGELNIDRKETSIDR